MFLFQLQLPNIGMLIAYILPKERLSCPAISDDAELRTQIILGIEDLFVENRRFCQENLFLLGSKMQW